MDQTELDKLIVALKSVFGARVKKARIDAGYTSQEKLAADATFDRGTIRDIERSFSGASFKTAVEISELTATPLAYLFPAYLLSQGNDERQVRIDSIRYALAQLDMEDIEMLGFVIDRLVEHRNRLRKNADK